MEHKQTGRVIFSLSILLVALACICPHPARLFSNLPWSEKLNLKPGIDMVGGTSLLYEIKPPEGGFHTTNGKTLAEQVMESLKKRVDPNGVRNLIWRPQGDRRLEIQMPNSTKSKEAGVARKAFNDASEQLEATNLITSQVINAVEQLTGDARAARLKELAGGVPSRLPLFNLLATTFDQKQAANAARNAAEEAAKTDEYEKLKVQLDDSNLKAAQLQAVLDNPARRAEQLGKLKAKFSDFPARLAAIDSFVKSYDAYSVVKDTVDDAGQLKQLLRGSGVLEFHIMADDLPESVVQGMVQRLNTKGPRLEAGDEVRWLQVDRPEEFRQAHIWNDKAYALVYITPDKSMVNGPGIDPWALESASIVQDKEGGRAVGFRFDVNGGHYFGDFTQNNKGRQLASVLDRKIITAANINSRIERDGMISRNGGYDDNELNYLISTLNAGSLPATLAEEPISERTVGPQLGQDNLRAGLIACVFGLVIVAVFLIGYYYLAGVVATFAVFMNVAMILGALAAINATFTLPGIAGIVLTIGAAVDANVLIFERLREEQHRGLSLRMAMRNAYDHARSAILDSNATTVITSIILILLGSEEVKGFGLTLLIGLVSSLFTSLFVTRTIFNVMIDKFNVDHLGSLPLTFPRWDKLLKPNIDWMKLVPYFATLSAVLIISGMTAFVMKARSGELADIDFASGTEVQVELMKPMPIGELRKIVEVANNPALPSPTIQSVASASDEKGKEPTTYEIITANVNARQVRDAVLQVLGSNLKVQLPSKFDHVGEAPDGLVGGIIVPITKTPFKVADFIVPNADAYTGGAAIVLNNLQPALRPSEIKSRVDSQRLQQQSGDQGSRYSDFTVVSPAGNDEPTSTAVVLVNDPVLPYDKDEAKWRENLVAPTWKLLNDSLNKPPQLQKVNNFDPQVAGDTQQDALMSLVLSALVILAYIWIRFGNFKYGFATVLAMIHDTLLVVGALGLAHWMSDYTPGLAKMLLVEPFRVNLTIVAAVLTIMSYSMIDTIVVFDRVRENRGKFGHLSRRIINDSINQTLSRTLLTCGTTIVTVAGMYVVGGPGIHGFTFVLLVGILVGTYSSIAIAAPILLIGSDAREENALSASRGAASGPTSRSLAGSR